MLISSPLIVDHFRHIQIRPASHDSLPSQSNDEPFRDLFAHCRNFTYKALLREELTGEGSLATHWHVKNSLEKLHLQVIGM